MPAFEFRDFGTFIGPQYDTGSYNYDEIQKEGYWHTDIATDTSFKKTDLGYLAYANQAAYVGHHLDGTAIVRMTMDAATGTVPLYYHLVNNTYVVGNTINTGLHTQNGDIFINGNAYMNGTTFADVIGTINVQSWKGFDISHPKKEGRRIRHICVEGPEAAIYIRGRCENTNVINLPEYWDGLVDLDQISVNLTPFGSQQNLFVEQIKWGKQVIIKNADGGPVNCFYQVWAPRLGELHVEYDGKSAKDYPGNQDEHSICGYHYDRRD